MLSESHQKFGIYKYKNCLAITIFIILLYFSSACRVTKGRKGKGNCQQGKEGWAHSFLPIVPLQNQPPPAFIKAISLLAVLGIELREFCISSKPLEFPKMDNTLKSDHCCILNCFVFQWSVFFLNSAVHTDIYWSFCHGSSGMWRSKKQDD